MYTGIAPLRTAALGGISTAPMTGSGPNLAGFPSGPSARCFGIGYAQISSRYLLTERARMTYV
jgi:hypothetical protein